MIFLNSLSQVFIAFKPLGSDSFSLFVPFSTISLSIVLLKGHNNVAKPKFLMLFSTTKNKSFSSKY